MIALLLLGLALSDAIGAEVARERAVVEKLPSAMVGADERKQLEQQLATVEDLRQPAFVFDHQHAHQGNCYRPAPAPILTFVSGTMPVSASRNGIVRRPGNDASASGSASSRP